MDSKPKYIKNMQSSKSANYFMCKYNTIYSKYPCTKCKLLKILQLVKNNKHVYKHFHLEM